MDIDSVIRKLVADSLPEFQGPGVQTEETSDYCTSGKAHFLEFARERTDGLFEKITFQKDFHKREWLISFQMVTHYFPECPIGAFPFGYDAGLENLIQESGITPAMDAWYSCGKSESEASERLKRMKAAIIEYVRPTFEQWANTLRADPVLNRAMQFYRAWPKNEADIRMFLENEINDVAQHAQEWRTSKAVSKIVSQMILRHSGSERWKWC